VKLTTETDLTGPMTAVTTTALRTVTLAERPDLAAAIPDVLASRWPAYMLAGDAGHDVDLLELLTVGAPQHQVLLIDDSDEVLGVGLSLPLAWDGTLAGLPAGWDGAVTASARLRAAGGTPNVVSALSITLSSKASGRGHAATMIAAMKAAATAAGLPNMLAPVRPVHKHRFPLVPMSEYLAWRTPDGATFDPWLRLHEGLGARQLNVAPQSMTITGTMAQWAAWTGAELPGNGQYLIPGGLVPMAVDATADLGTYVEPNVWMLHPAG
jgi:hypothetical protein